MVSIANDLPIDISRVLKSPTIIVILSISPFMYVNFCFICLGAPVLNVGWPGMCACVEDPC